LWPLSRKNTPKQFEKIIGDKSTLQLAVDRLQPDFKFADIYISTGEKYEAIVRAHLPQIPPKNFIFEPEMRDVGPAVGVAAAIIARQNPDAPVAIIWSDHFVKKERRFREVLKFAEELVTKDNESLIFMGQRARFANQNLGWLEFGEKTAEIRGTKIFQFKKLIYRPSLEQAEKFLESENFAWNPGYFVTTPKFLLSQYQKYAPSLWKKIMEIQAAYGESNYQAILRKVYPTMEKISFDDAVLAKIDPKHLFVIAADLGWSDVGAWEALKEALSGKTEENVTKGKVLLEDSLDNLVFNYTDQLVVGIDMQELIAINTDDVLLICPKNSVSKIKKIVESLAGTPNEKLT
jgi:mannose-1-phosphate guanylyltransferase